ncbi:GATA transcription factor 26-like isoform X7 [Macadamia integrifolia]|uniref:GATA transcription factor 26-like isoform X7 n=1 Tax=Macadamia integrifolia TaxID=60698 RepID=UPI001C4F2D32|nr:GATA transcription factor 26-like isoform X7 [Macadamia integrifolia]XP_042507725.1 GATA transcription factor 26-like isoform X7 [Macadamia integrifolia]
MENRNSFGKSDLFLTGYEDSSKRSSSVSVISCPESWGQLRATDGTNISVRSDFSNFKIPKRMRGRPSTVEKLRRDLFRILQEQESLCPSRSPEEVLIFKREDPQSSDEIGLGCVLLKPPVPGEEPKSQSIQVSATEGSKDRLIGAIGQVKQLEENPAKWSDLKEKYLERIRLGNSNTLQSMHSLQMHKNMKPSNKESFGAQNEITSHSAFILESGISVPTDRLSKPPCLPKSEVRIVNKMSHSDSCWSKRCRN